MCRTEGVRGTKNNDSGEWQSNYEECYHDYEVHDGQ